MSFCHHLIVLKLSLSINPYFSDFSSLMSLCCVTVADAFVAAATQEHNGAFLHFLSALWCNCQVWLKSEGSQMLFYVWFEFTSWLRGVGQGKGAWDRFPDHLGLGQLCLLSMRSMTTERLNLYSANDFVLARCGFVRFIALRCMLSLMF